MEVKSIVFGIFLMTILILSQACPVICDTSDTHTITDMAGREVTVPSSVNSVLGTNQAATTMIYVISPDKLTGLSSDYSKSKYIPDKYKNLPNVGGTQGKTKLNAESFQSMHPDVMFMPYTTGAEADVVDTQRQLNPIPVLALGSTTDITNFAEPVRFMGKVLGDSDKAEEFISFYQNIYKKVNQTSASIPESEKKRVYYAEGPEGLLTDPEGVGHTQPLEVSNGINVANVQFNGGIGRTPVSMEQILKWNPDVIIAFEKSFYDKIYSDPSWSQVKAVQDKQVYLVPSDPFNWYDRSPGINIVMGIPWTAKVLYPDKFKDLDLKAVTKEFYSKFYHYDLSDNDVDDILKGSGLTTY
jgi:iron complex transport system substrate-binding protein